MIFVAASVSISPSCPARPSSIPMYSSNVSPSGVSACAGDGAINAPTDNSAATDSAVAVLALDTVIARPFRGGRCLHPSSCGGDACTGRPHQISLSTQAHPGVLDTGMRLDRHRSEERRVGKEGRARGAASRQKRKKKEERDGGSTHEDGT